MLTDEALRGRLLVRWRTKKIEPPGRIERILGSARRRFEWEFCAQTAGRLSAESQAALLALATGADGFLLELKSGPGRLGLETMLEEIVKLRRAKALGFPADLFGGFLRPVGGILAGAGDAVLSVDRMRTLNAVRLKSHHTGATAHCGAAMDDQVYRRIGENIAKWRQRRGISQNVLAGLIGRSESWVSQVERGALKVDRLSVLVTVARELGVQVADLVDELPIVRTGNGPSFEGLQSLRSALQLPDSLRSDAEPERDPVKLRREMDDAWHLFHACRYGTLAAILPLLRSRIGANSQILAEYYQLTSGMIKKLGDAHLARLLAERSINHATDIRDDGLAAAGAWRLSFACQSLGLHDQAVSVAMAAESSLTSDAEHLAMRGALHLNAAIACGLKEDRVSAREHLAEARSIGRRVRDGNAHQTFFGPTNVRITEVSVAVELHDGVDPLAVSTSPPLIESAERRARHLIDLAYGHAQLGKDEAATERLLEADQIAHEEVRLNPRVRTFVGQLLDRERPSFRTKVRTLAQRAGVNRAS